MYFLYDCNPSVTIDLEVPKILAFLNKENTYSHHIDLFRFQAVKNLFSESMQIYR